MSALGAFLLGIMVGVVGFSVTVLVVTEPSSFPTDDL